QSPVPSADSSDPVATCASQLRVVTDPGDPATPPATRPPPTRPPRPTNPDVPQYSDLRQDGLRIDPNGVNVYFDVVNVGNMEARAAQATVTIAGYTRTGALAQYWGGTATTPNTVNPGQRGFIYVELPPRVLQRCTSYDTQLDVTRTMQGSTAGGPDVFANDTA